MEMDVGDEIKEALGRCSCKGCTNPRHVTQDQMCTQHMETRMQKQLTEQQELQKKLQAPYNPTQAPDPIDKQKYEEFWSRIIKESKCGV